MRRTRAINFPKRDTVVITLERQNFPRGTQWSVLWKQENIVFVIKKLKKLTFPLSSNKIGFELMPST
jgi:hypothetical protein